MVYKYLSAINGYVAVFFLFHIHTHTHTHTHKTHLHPMIICRNNPTIVRWGYISVRSRIMIDTFHAFATDVVIDLEPGCLGSVMPKQKFSHVSSSSVSCPNFCHNTELQLKQLEVPAVPVNRALLRSVTVRSAPWRLHVKSNNGRQDVV